MDDDNNTVIGPTRFSRYRDTNSGLDVIIKIITFGTLDKQFTEDTKSMAHHEDNVIEL